MASPVAEVAQGPPLTGGGTQTDAPPPALASQNICGALVDFPRGWERLLSFMSIP